MPLQFFVDTLAVILDECLHFEWLCDHLQSQHGTFYGAIPAHKVVPTVLHCK